eukprot:TRINITY_DN18616_c0_g2_i1.p1 TRINITY_DN18616_c0_g2~~TRINITY_DN18616_c0_g2_i1.p1  ORF type:complete len:196 (+),score=23.54 TRINITY_DN18616_c0_g2_i1:85-672(+)
MEKKKAREKEKDEHVLGKAKGTRKVQARGGSRAKSVFPKTPTATPHRSKGRSGSEGSEKSSQSKGRKSGSRNSSGSRGRGKGKEKWKEWQVQEKIAFDAANDGTVAERGSSECKVLKRCKRRRKTRCYRVDYLRLRVDVSPAPRVFSRCFPPLAVSRHALRRLERISYTNVCTVVFGQVAEVFIAAIARFCIHSG